MFIRSPAELAIAVKRQRKKLHFNQSNLGDLVGLKQKTVSAFENKPEATQLETLFRLLSAANLEMHIHVKGQPIESTWEEEW